MTYSREKLVVECIYNTNRGKCIIHKVKYCLLSYRPHHFSKVRVSNILFSNYYIHFILLDIYIYNYGNVQKIEKFVCRFLDNVPRKQNSKKVNTILLKSTIKYNGKY